MTNEAPPACRSPRQVEQLLGGGAEILGMADTPSGSQGAKILTLRSKPDGVVFRVRWRAQSTDGLINEPRKELAAYAVQKLFLGEGELVAPPTMAHCFPLAAYRRFAPSEPPSFENIDCVLGFASYWLEGVKDVDGAREDDLLSDGDGIWDEKLFESDAVYRASVSKSNLLTYLINHGDAHTKQFMLEQTPRGLRTYVVDSSIAFLSIKNPMLLLREDWSQIQVPSLPQRAIERLKALAARDLASLSKIVELERRNRQLFVTTETSPDFESDGSAMSWQGARLRIGLTQKEIELVSSRIRELLARADLPKLSRP